MKKICVLFMLFAFLTLVLVPDLAHAISEEKLHTLKINIENREEDIRILKLEAYLISKKSPFADQAKLIIQLSDKYELPDWKLLPAITGVESGFGRHIPKDSYNAVGWVNGAYKFKSWPDSFGHVAKTLKEKYIDRGLDTVEKIAPVYAPPSRTWAGKVRFFMGDIEKQEVEISEEPEFTL